MDYEIVTNVSRIFKVSTFVAPLFMAGTASAEPVTWNWMETGCQNSGGAPCPAGFVGTPTQPQAIASLSFNEPTGFASAFIRCGAGFPGPVGGCPIDATGSTDFEFSLLAPFQEPATNRSVDPVSGLPRSYAQFPNYLGWDGQWAQNQYGGQGFYNFAWEGGRPTKAEFHFDSIEAHFFDETATVRNYDLFAPCPDSYDCSFAGFWVDPVSAAASVPEPSSAAIILSGMTGAWLWRRRGRTGSESRS